MNTLGGLYPAFVRFYDAEQRLARVEIPGITDGAELLPEAEFNYPFGDKSEHTEIRVLVGDRVNVMFEGGDPRYPIIIGYRPKREGNDVGTRRWHHANIQAEADELLHLKAKRVLITGLDTATIETKAATVNATNTATVTTAQALIEASGSASVVTPSALVDAANTRCTGNLKVDGNLEVAGNASAANVEASGDVKVGDISLKNHRTAGVTPGGGLSGPPAPP